VKPKINNIRSGCWNLAWCKLRSGRQWSRKST